MTIYFTDQLLGITANVRGVLGSPSESYARRADPSASVQLWCDYNYYMDVVNDLLTPRSWPGNDKLFVDTVNVKFEERRNDSGQSHTYTTAVLDVIYTPKPSGEYTENISNITNMNTLPPHIFQWDNGMNLKQGEEPSFMTFMQKITHGYEMVRSIPQEMVTKLGHVNTDTITTSQGIVCQPETLLYIGCESSIAYDKFGTLGWQMTTSFMFNPITWNKWWNIYVQQFLGMRLFNEKGGVGSQEGKGSWDPYKMYPETELNGIFEFVPPQN